MIEYIDRLEEIIVKSMHKYGVPGVAVSIIDKYKPLWTKCFGFADIKSKTPISNDTLFQVASISKTFTAWVIMKLAESGILGLDDSVDKHLLRWHINNEEVTIRRILSHTAGLNVPSYLGYKPGEHMPSLEESLCGSVRKTQKLEVIKKPADVFLYSGGGFTLLQLMIEDITGIPFSQYMRSEILEPLGMQNSTFDWDVNNTKIATAYSPFKRPVPNYLFVEKAAAGLYSTIDDMHKFIEANLSVYENDLDDNKCILNKESIRLMHSRVQRNIHSGLGNFVLTLPKNIKVITHGGDNMGWCARFMIMPKKGNGIVILTNGDNGQNVISDIVGEWLEKYTGKLPKYYYKQLKLEKMGRIQNFINNKLFISNYSRIFIV